MRTLVRDALEAYAGVNWAILELLPLPRLAELNACTLMDVG
jgi:hypothetical protein